MGDTYIWAPSFNQFGGGIAQFSRELAKAYGGSKRLFGKFDYSGRFDGTILVGAGGYPLRTQSIFFALQLIIYAMVNRPTLIVSTHVNFGPIARLLHRLIGTPYVLIAHGIEVLPGMSKKRHEAIVRASRVLCVSAWTKERIIELGVDPEKIGVIMNTVDVDRFSVDQGNVSQLRKELGIGEEKKVILTVARLSASEGYKGYDRILESLPVITDEFGEVVYVIVGKGDDKDRVSELVKSRGMEAHVRLVGFVSDQDLPDYYRMADVFAMPSTGEGYGIVFLEAMACGTPVLGGNKDGSVDALDNGRLGLLVDPEDIKAVSEGIVSLLKCQGPLWWYEPERLRDAVLAHAGPKIYRRAINVEIAKINNS